MNNYEHSDHVSLRDAINLELQQYQWIVSYDNVQEIKDIYEGYRMSAFDLTYSLQQKRLGSELLIFSDQIEICEDLNIHNRVTAIELL